MLTFTADDARFPGDFRLASRDATPAETAYREAAAGLLDVFAYDLGMSAPPAPAAPAPPLVEGDEGRAEAVVEPASPPLPAAGAQETARRRRRLAALAAQARMVAAATALAPPPAGLEDMLTRETARALGWRSDELRALEAPLFAIDVRTDATELRRAVELVVKVAPARTAFDPAPNEAQTALLGDVLRAERVARVVFDRSEKTDGDRALLDDMLRKLAAAAQLGLGDGQIAAARRGLDALKEDYRAGQALKIKSRHFEGLASAAFVTIALCLAGAATLHAHGQALCGYVTDAPAGSACRSGSMFFIAMAGSSLGACLSFLIRRADVGFDDLLLPQDDLVTPFQRLFFVAALTLVVCLLFWTKAVTFNIGGFGSAQFGVSGSVSFLIGAFCGLAEQAVASAIGGRAAEFSSRLGATKPPG